MTFWFWQKSFVIGCLYSLSFFTVEWSTGTRDCFLMIKRHNTTEEQMFSFVILFFFCAACGRSVKGLFLFSKRNEFLFLSSSAGVQSSAKGVRVFVEPLYFGTRFQWVSAVHIRRSRHEVWDDESERKRKVPRTVSSHHCPCLSLVVLLNAANRRTPIRKLNICVFSSKLKLTKSYRNLLKLHNISKYMWNQVKLYIYARHLSYSSFKTLIFFF